MQLSRAVGLSLGLGLSAFALARPSFGEVAATDVRTTVLFEPSETSHLLVITPGADVAVKPVDFLDLHVGYEADIVTGATEAVKSGPIVDVVTTATAFNDTRHVFRGGFTFERKSTRVSADYSYGMENDYRSQAISVSAGSEFLQKNTEIEISYARGFDKVCTTAYTGATGPSARTRLDSSDGCFTSAPDRAQRDIDIDVFQAGWTQAWTPILSTQLVLTGSLQHGFLENPYRGVVITPAGLDALENQPDNRARGAIAVRANYFIKPINAAATVGARLYRDTWDIVGQTYEAQFEQYIGPALRVLAHGRYYTQTGALFYSNDYTGGEPLNGPRGQYWTGDRELSPLSSYLLGGRVLVGFQGAPGARLLGAFLRFQASGGFDFLKTNLRDFTWGGVDPDDTTSMIVSAALRAEF